MKKIAALVFSALLIFSLASIVATAEDTVNPDGFRFNIKAINGTIEGEDGIIITKQEAIANANLKWPIILICEKVSDGVYKVKQDPIVTQGEAPDLTLNKDEIIIAIHSSTSDLSLKDKFKNVEQKVAARNVKVGMYFTFEGIDLENETCENGIAICSSKAPETSTPAESSKTTESSSTSKESSSSVASTESKNNSQETSSKTATSSTTGSQQPKTGDAGTIVNVIIAIMALSCAATVAVKKRSR